MASDERQTRVLVVGAGIAGLSCAWSLACDPRKRFRVSVWDAAARPGGVATTEEVARGVSINDGVQGAPPTYHNLLRLHKELGFTPHEIRMRISFGRGDRAWSNYEQRPVQQRFESEIERFGRVLRWWHRFEPLFIAIPINVALRTFGFSAEFGSAMVYPLVALFFGTGNQTMSVPAALIARVFLDPELRIFEYDPKWLLSQTPKFYAFRELSTIYHTFVERILDEGRKPSTAVASACSREEEVKMNDETPTCASFSFNRRVRRVVRRGKGRVMVEDANGDTAEFDRLVFACSAEQVLAVLAQPTLLERWVLGNVQYYDDVTVTHTDEAYMRKHYRVGTGEQYFIHNYAKRPELIEMSFDLSNYQPMLCDPVKGSESTGGGDSKSGESERPRRRVHPRVYQTIFLDKKGCSSMWTIRRIAEGKILLRKWWRQFAHTYKHFLFTVPLLRFVQNTKGCYYAGAYTLFNTHELACVSGLSAAERLGAPYPYSDDAKACKTMNTYTLAAHGVVRGRGFCRRVSEAALGTAMRFIVLPVLVLLQVVFWVCGL